MGKSVLILPGGGAKGRWQAGVIHALHDNGSRWNTIIGTSVGSINAAAYGILGPETLSNLWETDVRATSDILSPTGWWKYIKGPYNILFKGGFYNLNPCRNILTKHLSGKSPVFCDDIYVCKVSIRTGRVVYAHHSEDDFIESILGSSSIPGVIQPIGEWADGSLNERSVIKRAIKQGADKITVILCDQFVPTNVTESRFAILNILRSAHAIAHESIVREIHKCVAHNTEGSKRFIDLEVYAPLGDTVGTLEFGPKDPHNIWKRGYNVGSHDPVTLIDVE